MTEFNDKVKLILEWLLEKKAENTSTYDFSGRNSFTDFVIICEGQADLHVRAIGNHLLDMVKEHHFSLLSKEGLEYSHWALVDLGDIIVHIFLPETREYYKIDEFISGCLNKMDNPEKQL
jgi:ribosome-associated protein